MFGQGQSEVKFEIMMLSSPVARPGRAWLRSRFSEISSEIFNILEDIKWRELGAESDPAEKYCWTLLKPQETLFKNWKLEYEKERNFSFS